MQMSVRNLREEAKVCSSSVMFNSSHSDLLYLIQREGLCAGAKTKSGLAYSMVKEKRPRRCNFSPNRSPKGKGSDIRRGSRYCESYFLVYPFIKTLDLQCP